MKKYIFCTLLHVCFIATCSEQPRQPRSTECKLDPELCKSIECNCNKKELQKLLANMQELTRHIEQTTIPKVDQAITRAEGVNTNIRTRIEKKNTQ